MTLCCRNSSTLPSQPQNMNRATIPLSYSTPFPVSTCTAGDTIQDESGPNYSILGPGPAYETVTFDPRRQHNDRTNFISEGYELAEMHNNNMEPGRSAPAESNNNDYSCLQR